MVWYEGLTDISHRTLERNIKIVPDIQVLIRGKSRRTNYRLQRPMESGEMSRR